jgi:hypothetical protein
VLMCDRLVLKFPKIMSVCLVCTLEIMFNSKYSAARSSPPKIILSTAFIFSFASL